MIEYINTNKAASAAGHYSQGTIANGFIFTATQLPIDPTTPDASKGSIQQQTEQVLRNIIEVVTSGGGSKDSITKIMIYMSDVSHWDEINIAYEKMLGAHKPARGVLEIKNIRKGFDVSMDAIAVVENK